MKINDSREKAELIKAPNIKFPHAFSGRKGGVSEDAFFSLNVGFDIGDRDENVRENRRIFAESAGFDPNSTVWMKQIHSADVRYVASVPETVPECDGLVTDVKGLALCVKTADCAPILLCDGDARVIGAVHAGWRGTVAGIAAECLRIMKSRGAKTENISAAIGPCIRKCCYGIDEPFIRAVREAVGSELCEKYVQNGFADIAGLNVALLKNAGVTDIHVIDACTCCRPERFFSHRYSHGKRGVMGSGICM